DDAQIGVGAIVSALEGIKYRGRRVVGRSKFEDRAAAATAVCTAAALIGDIVKIARLVRNQGSPGARAVDSTPEGVERRLACAVARDLENRTSAIDAAETGG